MTDQELNKASAEAMGWHSFVVDGRTLLKGVSAPPPVWEPSTDAGQAFQFAGEMLERKRIAAYAVSADIGQHCVVEVHPLNARRIEEGTEDGLARTLTRLVLEAASATKTE